MALCFAAGHFAYLVSRLVSKSLFFKLPFMRYVFSYLIWICAHIIYNWLSWLLLQADLAQIGDACGLYGTTLATHLFEDRILKFGPIKLHDYCLLGDSSIVQKNCELASSTTLGPCSLLVQNECTLPDSTFIGHMGFPMVCTQIIVFCNEFCWILTTVPLL